jgi:hypothetical protein
MGSREQMAELSEKLKKTGEPKTQNTASPVRTQQTQSRPTQPKMENTNQTGLGAQARAEFNELDLVSRFNALKFLQNTLTLYKVSSNRLALQRYPVLIDRRNAVRLT